MIKKTFLLLIILLLITTAMFCGCVENTEKTLNRQIFTNNNNPIGVINAPKEAYFDENILFDASSSYDTDGKIKTYQWDFGDGTTANGKKVTHHYNLQQEFDIIFPLIYTVLLLTTDNNNSLGVTSYQISLFPKVFTFYLDNSKLLNEMPYEGKESIKTNFLINKEEIKNEINYEFEKFIALSTCNWNMKINIEKPLFLKINKINIVLSDVNSNEISSTEYSFKNLDLWSKKYIELSGKINSNYNFKSLKISVYTLSLRNKINIIYGGEKPSCISFNFL